MLKRKTTILLLCPYPLGDAPSQRFRFEQYLNILAANGFEVKAKPLLNEATWSILYSPRNYLRKTVGLLKGLFLRWVLLFQVNRFDFVFIHREAAPIGPPFFEWVIAKILKKKIIYDFDDAIWLPNTSHENKLVSWIKWHSKVKSICRWSYKVSTGNEYLCAFARQSNQEVYLIPTTIDTDHLHNPVGYPKKANQKIIIGWTGTHSTLKYLGMMETVFCHLNQQIDEKIELHIIADRPPELKIPFQFIRWSKETEIQELMQFDIGIMPLRDDSWSQGKCGFKALQYMALQIPTVASPVGVAPKIIEDGKNGFLCQTLQEWEGCLLTLIENKELRNSIGLAARQKIVDSYSVSSNSQNFLSLFS